MMPRHRRFADVPVPVGGNTHLPTLCWITSTDSTDVTRDDDFQIIVLTGIRVLLGFPLHYAAWGLRYSIPLLTRNRLALRRRPHSYWGRR